MENLQSLVGLLAFAAKMVVPGRAFLRRLYNILSAEYPKTRVTAARKENLRWWRDILPKWNGIGILRKSRPVIKVRTDTSSNSGIGRYMLASISHAICHEA